MDLNKVLIIFNPASGKRYPADYRQKFINQLKWHLPDASSDWLETTPNLMAQLKTVNFKNYQRLIVIGGDGTVTTVADFLLNNKIDLPLAIIPQGSANVLASSLDIPLADKRAIKTAALGKEKKIDVGLLNKKHYFFICLSLGFWSKVVKQTERGLKLRLGFWAYFLSFLKQKKLEQTAFRLKLDDNYLEIAGNTLVVANALSLFKLKSKRKIDFTDGLFDVLITQNRSFWGFLTLGLLAIFNRRFLPSLFLTQAQKIIINPTTEQLKTVQMDGEPIEIDKIEIEIIPKKLKIITTV